MKKKAVGTLRQVAAAVLALGALASQAQTPGTATTPATQGSAPTVRGDRQTTLDNDPQLVDRLLQSVDRRPGALTLRRHAWPGETVPVAQRVPGFQ